MGILVNGAFGALAAVVGSLLSITFVSNKLAFPGALLFGLVGFFGAGQVFAAANAAQTEAPAERKPRRKGQAAAQQQQQAPQQSQSADVDYEDDASVLKAAKKAKKVAAEKAKKEAAEVAKAAEAAAKLAAKKLAKKKAAVKAKAAAAAAAIAPESESESEEEASPEPEPEPESEEDAAPKSKTAIKKAKAKAKELAAKAEAAAAAKVAEKAAKKQKKSAAAAEPAAATSPAAAPAKSGKITEKAAAAVAAAAAAIDLDGWETIEATKPTKSQLAAKAAAPAEPTSTKGKKKNESIPTSERELEEHLLVPISKHALLVGKAGATHQLLVAGSGARIDMPKKDSASSKIVITGTPAQVHAAKNAIESLIERGFSQFTHPGHLSDDLNIDPKEIGQVIGANGANLRKIQDATATKINLPEKGSNSKKVTIVGEKEGVKAAKAAIKSLIADGFSTITNPTWIKREVDVPQEKFGVLIGPKGQSIKSIQGDTGTRVNLPPKGSPSTSVSVVGEEAGVTRALKQIAKLLEPPAPLPEPEDHDLATEDAWGQEHTAQGEDALW